VALNVGGKWDDARTIPVIAINSVMLPTGKVLMFAYPARPGYEDPGDPGDYAKAYVWDPVSGTSDEVPHRSIRRPASRRTSGVAGPRSCPTGMC